MKRILMMACAVVVLASCSKETNEPTMPSDASQIKANSVIEGVATKAITGNTDELSSITFLRYDDVATDKTTSFDFSASTTISGSRATGGAITFTPAQQYDQANDKTSYILGYHPAGTLTDKVAKWIPDGATDILMTDVWSAGRYSSPITTGMTFRHILARIEVVCQAEGGAALSVVQAMWGNIESIKFVGALPDMTYTYATNAVAAAGTPADFTLLNGDAYREAFTSVAMPANGSTAVTASAMLPPVDATAISLKVKTASQNEIIVPITLSGNFEKGKIHKVTLTFKANGKNIDATASTIADWANGYIGNGDVAI